MQLKNEAIDLKDTNFQMNCDKLNKPIHKFSFTSKSHHDLQARDNKKI